MLAMTAPAAPGSGASFGALLTRDRWIEIGRIVAVGAVALLYQGNVVSRPVLLGAGAVGLYPLVTTGLKDLVRDAVLRLVCQPPAGQPGVRSRACAIDSALW